MSLDESVNLVLYAMSEGEHGQVLVQKSPSARVDTIAKAVMNLMNSAQKLQYIGERHSEKMHEILVSENEMSRSIEREDYFIINFKAIIYYFIFCINYFFFIFRRNG